MPFKKFPIAISKFFNLFSQLRYPSGTPPNGIEVWMGPVNVQDSPLRLEMYWLMARPRVGAPKKVSGKRFMGYPPTYVGECDSY